MEMTEVHSRTRPLDLMKGLSWLPWGVLLLAVALGYWRGVLRWLGPRDYPFAIILGAGMAWLVEKLIKRHYRKTYDYAFDDELPLNLRNTRRGRTIIIFVIVLLVAALLGSIVDSFDQPPVRIRILPLPVGAYLLFRGIYWMRRGWKIYGLLHSTLGMVAIVFCFLPLAFNVSVLGPLFGLIGILESTIYGVVLIMAGLMEHRIFLMTRTTQG